MHVIHVLRSRDCIATVRGDKEYHSGLSIDDMDIEYHEGTQLTNEEFHQAAKELKLKLQVDDYKSALKEALDNQARQMQYDDERSIASYASSTKPEWANEAKTYIQWRDDVWEYAIAEYDKFENGQRELVTVDEFIAELPKYPE